MSPPPFVVTTRRGLLIGWNPFVGCAFALAASAGFLSPLASMPMSELYQIVWQIKQHFAANPPPGDEMNIETDFTDYQCWNCDGTGESECECCGSEQTCDECEGTGWDSTLVNIQNYQKACRRLRGNGLTTWEYRVNGVRAGRTNGVWHAVVTDFLKDEKRKSCNLRKPGSAQEKTPLFAFEETA